MQVVVLYTRSQQFLQTYSFIYMGKFRKSQNSARNN